MDTVIPGLTASAPGLLPFDPSLAARAFHLRRGHGKLLIYGSAAIEREAAAIKDLGGLARQYLNHRHEAAPTCDWVGRTFGARSTATRRRPPRWPRRAESTRPSASGTASPPTSRSSPPPATRPGPSPACGAPSRSASGRRSVGRAF